MRCNELWQRSRQNWLRVGDANSKFFHRTMLQRRRRNEILQLDVDGEVYQEVDSMELAMRGFFPKTFLEETRYYG